MAFKKNAYEPDKSVTCYECGKTVKEHHELIEDAFPPKGWYSVRSWVNVTNNGLPKIMMACSRKCAIRLVDLPPNYMDCKKELADRFDFVEEQG